MLRVRVYFCSFFVVDVCVIVDRRSLKCSVARFSELYRTVPQRGAGTIHAKYVPVPVMLRHTM